MLSVFAAGSVFADAQKIKFVQDLSIKSNEADDRTSFLSVERVDSDSKGNIYALASREYKVQVYDPKGAYLRTIGKKGQGPGEFEVPVNIIVGKDDFLYVFDYAKAAFVVFDPQGKYVNNLSMKGKLFDISLQIVLDSSGHFVVGYDSIPEESFKIIRFDREFNKGEDLFVKTGISTLLKKPGGIVTEAPFAPGVVWAMDEKENLYTCFNKSYEIEVYSPGRKLLRTISRKIVPDEVTKADIDEILKRSRGLLVAGDFPKYKPAVARMFSVGPHLFVRVKRIDLIYLFHVYDREGNFVEELNLDFQPFIYKNGYVYSIRANRDFSECEILRFKISF